MFLDSTAGVVAERTEVDIEADLEAEGATTLTVRVGGEYLYKTEFWMIF